MLWKRLAVMCLILAAALPAMGKSGRELGNVGTFHKWHKVEVVLRGPSTSATADPNPFLTLVDVTFTGPGGTFVVPAFYDGDGIGGGSGDVWKVRFSANAAGLWRFRSSSAERALDGYRGSFTVDAAPRGAPKLLKWGRLEYVGGHYLKFADGPYWIKGGTDDPENWLGKPFGGWDGKKAKIDYLASKGVNCVYFITHTIGGDGNDTWPWLGDTQDEAKADSTRFNPAKLLAWEDFLTYCEGRGLVMHIILEDDDNPPTWKGFDRGLYYREMMARFAHHPAVIWNLCEKNPYTNSLASRFSALLRSWDPYDHPVTIQRGPSNENWPLIGDENFQITCFETDPAGSVDIATTPMPDINAIVISNRRASVCAGQPIPISVDEIPGVFSMSDAVRLKMRSEVLYAIYLAGGMHEIHWNAAILSLEDMGPMWDDMRIAREFIESLPFWEMEPANELLSDAKGNFCLAKPGAAYGVYLRDGRTISLDLTGAAGSYQVRWHNVLTGETASGPVISGGCRRSLGEPAYPGDVACSVVRVR